MEGRLIPGSRHSKYRSLVGGALAGLAAGLLVAVIATVLDWRLNPGGVFHGNGGSNWAVIIDTALSWFWPLAGLVGGVTVASLWCLRRR